MLILETITMLEKLDMLIVRNDSQNQNSLMRDMIIIQKSNMLLIAVGRLLHTEVFKNIFSNRLVMKGNNMYKIFILSIVCLVTASYSLCSTSYKQRLIMNLERKGMDTTYYYNNKQVCFDGDKIYIDNELFPDNSSSVKDMKILDDGIIMYFYGNHMMSITNTRVSFAGIGWGLTYYIRD